MPDDTAADPNEPKVIFHQKNHQAGTHTDRYQPRVDICRNHVDVDGLHYVCHFVDGAATFSVDILDSDILAAYLTSKAPESGDGDLGDAESLRGALVALANRFDYDIAQLDKQLRQARTGNLMRTVLQVEHGGVYWYWIHENEYLLGLTLSMHTVDAADEAMARIGEAVLRRLHRPPRNYGGYLRRITDHDSTSPPAAEAKVGWPIRRSKEIDDDIVALCRNALDLRDLHYVAYFARGKWQFSVDVLDCSPATTDFGGLDNAQRRAFYEQAGQDLQFSTGQLDLCLTTLAWQRPGKLVRTVLDVESGALYHHPLIPGHYIVGVTLFQDRVGNADFRIRRLVNNLGARFYRPGVFQVA